LTANVSALYPGSYTVTVWIVPLPNQSPVSLPVQVTLTVTAPAPSGPSIPIVTPSSLSIVSFPGSGQRQLLNVDSPNPYTLFGVSLSDAQGFLSFSVSNQTSPSREFYTPATLQVSAGANQPGTYGGAIVLTTSDGSVSVPVTLYVTAWPGVSPVMSMIVNAVSGLPGAISPGEIVAIYGSGIGAAPVGLTLDATGKTATNLEGTEVLINGVAAPLVYASEGEVKAIVPDEVGTVGIATVQVNWKGLTTDVWGVPLSAGVR
jgi:hypothetical protein